MSTSNSKNGNSRTSDSQISNWQTSPRWRGITRPYNQHDVNRLRGSFQIEHTLARYGAERLWNLLDDEAESYIPALGAMTGNQAIQQVKAGL
jgi:isocitrate lyase